MRISDWSSDVCSSDLVAVSNRHRCSPHVPAAEVECDARRRASTRPGDRRILLSGCDLGAAAAVVEVALGRADRDADRHRAPARLAPDAAGVRRPGGPQRSEEPTSALQSLMRSSYAGFCFKKQTRQRAIATNKQ